MKKILLSLAVIAVIAAIGIGATVAYFSDVQTSTGNTIAAGTLDLNVDSGNDNVIKFDVADVVPGQNGTGTWTLNNVGSIDGYLDLELIAVANSENGCVEPETESGDTTCEATEGELAEKMNVDLFVDTDDDGTLDTGETVIYSGPLSGIAASYNQNLLIASGEINYITMNWTVPVDTTNVIQGDSITLDITFELGQTPDQ